MAIRKATTPELKVVFDTSVLYTQVASDLVRDSISTLIAENSAHSDLNVTWIIPDVVIGERRFQMRSRARELLPPVRRLERLLGHNLNITEEILDIRVEEAITRHLEACNLTVHVLDTSNVNWTDIIERSVTRSAPFELGEKEKGFKDSLIAESFLQLVEQSPTTPSVCRLAIVAEDQLLRSHLESRTKDNQNVRVLSNIGELESLINTLVSKVTEEFVSDIAPKIKSYFFDKESGSGLYFKENVGERIREQFGDELRKSPIPDTFRENGTWWIAEPVFEKKDRQRTYWASSINVDSKLIKHEYPQPTDTGAIFSSGVSGNALIPSSSLSSTTLISPSSPTATLGSNRAITLGGQSLPKRVEVAEGHTTLRLSGASTSRQPSA